MKNALIPALLAAALTITACSKSPVSPNSDDSSISAARHGADDAPVAPPAALPSAVKSAFATRYPAATRMEWEPEDGNTWKVKFFLGNQRWIATFKADGTFISAQLK